jgi:hypothetical protein
MSGERFGSRLAAPKSICLSLDRIRVALESGTASASLETQDVGPETIDHPGHSPEKPKVDQTTSADASQKAARET